EPERKFRLFCFPYFHFANSGVSANFSGALRCRTPRLMLNQLTISDFSAKLAKREITCHDVMQACLDRIRQVDGQIKAFISVDEQDALRQAEEADRLAAQGKARELPLLGVPVGIKDVIAVKDQPLNCGSRILGNFVSPYDATVIQKLKAAGA